MNFYKYMASMAVVAVAASLTACSDDDDTTLLTEAIYPSAVQLTLPEEASQLVYTDETGTEALPMIVGQSYQLKGSLQPDNVTFRDVLWNSSSPENVKVDANGKITAVSGSGFGFAVISITPDPARSGSSINASIKVVVSETVVPAQQIVISSESDELFVGDQLQLSASILPSNATYRTVKWTSSDESVATVDAKGVVTGVNTEPLQSAVTITATTLDGSGVSASKVIYVNKVVPPESVSLSRTFDKSSGYLCAINERGLTIDFTTVPAASTVSMLRWESSDESIATVDGGKVTFNTKGVFGDVTIRAICPESGQSDEITLSMPAGLHRELFHNPDHFSWGDNSANMSHTTWHDGYISIEATGTSKLRQDFKCYEPAAYFHAGEYPILAFKMDDVRDMPGVTGRNITVDANNATCDGKTFKGGLNGTNNKWLHDYLCSDGSHVFIYDFTEQGWQTGGKLPTTAVATFPTLSVKYADIVGASGNSLTYKVYWIQESRRPPRLYHQRRPSHLRGEEITGDLRDYSLKSSYPGMPRPVRGRAGKSRKKPQ